MLRRRPEYLTGILLLVLLAGRSTLAQDDLLDQIKQNSKDTAQPSGDIAPDTQSAVDPLGTKKAKSPIQARIGTLTLSNGKKYEGRIWTTLATPLRVWLEGEKRYNDIDLNLVKTINVIVDAAGLEDDWRWLKEGSDKKIYSGKKYPNVSLRYKFVLVNDQVVEGTVVAPMYVYDGVKTHPYALYKKFKGTLGQSMDDVIYIKSVSLRGNPVVDQEKNYTTRLPLIMD